MVQGDRSLEEDGTMILQVSLIDAEAQIEAGQAIVTSQLSSQYLPGILIGYLTDYSVDSSNLTMSGHLTPVVDFTELKTVLVITTLKDSEELEQMLSDD